MHPIGDKYTVDNDWLITVDDVLAAWQTGIINRYKLLSTAIKRYQRYICLNTVEAIPRP
jgi:hypothetical protein